MTVNPVREHAGRTALAIAGKLSDPRRVAAIADAPDNAMMLPDDNAVSPWTPLSLTDGYPGVALLFAELAAHDRGAAAVAHDHLSLGLATPVEPRPGLFEGAASLAFAANAAAAGCGGYTTLLAALDRVIATNVRFPAAESGNRARGGAVVGSWMYDAIAGIAGLGRYLLSRHGAGADAAVEASLREVLSALVDIAVAEDVLVDGHPVPAWWVTHDVSIGPPQAPEHLNFGVAHGIGGPLALLAVAWTAGVRVPRQDEGISRIVELLLRWQATDQAGPYWPHWLTAHDMRDPRSVLTRPRVRDVWCYGAAGLARSLYLAGVALADTGWQQTAHDAMYAVLGAECGLITDFSLCHGWAGLLQITMRMSIDSGQEGYRAAADGLAAKIVAAFGDDKAFGYHMTHPTKRLGVDRPGFLEGAAGIALALQCYSTDEPPVTGWDSALLLD